MMHQVNVIADPTCLSLCIQIIIFIICAQLFVKLLNLVLAMQETLSNNVFPNLKVLRMHAFASSNETLNHINLE